MVKLLLVYLVPLWCIEYVRLQFPQEGINYVTWHVGDGEESEVLFQASFDVFISKEGMCSCFQPLMVICKL